MHLHYHLIRYIHQVKIIVKWNMDHDNSNNFESLEVNA